MNKSRSIKSKKVKAAVLLAAALSADIASADNLSFNSGIGFYQFDDSFNLNDQSFYRLGLQYNYNDKLSIETFWSKSNEIESRHNTASTYDWTYANIDALYYFKPGEAMRPFVTLGLGESELDSGKAKHDETLVNLGGGVQFYYKESFSIKADLKGISSLDNEKFSSTATISFSVPLGGDTAKSNSPDAELTQAEEKIIGRDIAQGYLPHDVPIKPGFYKASYNFNFENGSTDIRPEYYNQLESLAKVLRNNPTAIVSIEGHTDSTGSTDSNIYLSRERAESVVRVLIERFGIGPKRLNAVGYGERSPIASNMTPEGRAKNRRIDARIKISGHYSMF